MKFLHEQVHVLQGLLTKKMELKENSIKTLGDQLDEARAESNEWARKLHLVQSDSVQLLERPHLCKAEAEALSCAKEPVTPSRKRRAADIACVDLSSPPSEKRLRE